MNIFLLIADNKNNCKNYLYLCEGNIMGNNRKKELTENDLIKLEIAKEIGLIDKIDELGWGGLTAKESGRIGGIMTAKKRKGKKIDDEAKLL